MGRTLVIIAGVFVAVGLVLGGLGGWFYFRNQGFVEGGVRAQGEVVDIVSSRSSDDDTTYKPMVEFRDAAGARHIFTATVGSNPPQYSRGEAVEVIYAPDAPDEAMIDGFLERYLLPLILGGLGSVFAAIGLGILFVRLRGNRIADQLRATGLPLEAKVTRCYLDTQIKVNGRSPWRVECQAIHPASGAPETFASQAIWTDPGARLAGREVRVFVDPSRPKRHLVDLAPYFGADELG